MSEGSGSGSIDLMIMQLVVRHGERIIYRDVEDDEGRLHNLSLAQYIQYDLGADNLQLHSPIFCRMLNEAAAKSADPAFKAEPYFLHHENIEVSRIAAQLVADDYPLIARKQEEPLNEAAQKQQENNETDDLRNQAIHLMLDFRMDFVEKQLKAIQAEMSRAMGDNEKLLKLMSDYRDMQAKRNALAKRLGNNIIV